MHEFAVLVSILGVFLLGAISPGPSFVVVSRIAISGTRADGVMAAIGMGIGGFIFATVAVAGLTAILLQVEWLNLALRLAGGAYLVWLGVNIWRAAPELLDITEATAERPSTLWKSLLKALFVQLSNPKTAIFYASMFAALLPSPTPSWMYFALPPMLFLIEFAWYTVVAVGFSARAPKAAYLRSKIWIDRAAGAVVGALGAKLMTDSVRLSV
ncbi:MULTISPECIES: LysE family transporter [unclassified Bosea (in: a-proteobacteria)]|uniref:LysE family translocator n=1 Tax=unclassified Bosea (in: a-proteobacteria) TaxID=2653178 RepID=UPI000F75BD97|nr:MULTISPECIES: LysE family transporter [unclassified Bosea (in: a-proteobacteria)]AZO76695.1 threonine transporter [Bosea sp. Tri-49]RXT21528.1 threonine transporter [Bosea sp. Tri-39]RXT31867.1 threonine transporter [Bosea sp. Tri-54]